MRSQAVQSVLHPRNQPSARRRRSTGSPARTRSGSGDRRNREPTDRIEEHFPGRHLRQDDVIGAVELHELGPRNAGGQRQALCDARLPVTGRRSGSFITRRRSRFLPDTPPVEGRDAIRDALAGLLGAEGGVRLTDFSVKLSESEVLGKAIYAQATTGSRSNPSAMSWDRSSSTAPMSTSCARMRRAMIQDTLDGAKSKRYRYASRHLAECQSCDQSIDDNGDFPAHAQFVGALKQKHGRKHGFWELTGG
jgi:hypothetical protein